MLQDLARAKVNLCLHVTGQRDDGLHLLDSLVVFPDVGDVLRVAPADTLTLDIDGPFAGDLKGDNLVLQAARLLSDRGAAIGLEKNLPVASGIGGGSADAAAALRVLSNLWGIAIPAGDTLSGLGADVPVCMKQHPVRMQGIGDILTPLPPLPAFWIVLVNSGEGVNTGAVFQTMETRQNPPISTLRKAFPDCASLFAYLGQQRNDMQGAASRMSPVINTVLAQLSATPGCALARMSGSGGTCFGLYRTQDAAEAAAKAIQSAQPDWWVAAARV